MSATSFENWLDAIFLERESCDVLPEMSVRYLTRLYGEYERYLSGYSDTQIANGLYDILSPTGFGYISALMDDNVKLMDKLNCLDSMVALFEGYMAKKCDDVLFHSLKSSPFNLNQVCYMWWDIAQIYPARDLHDWGADFDAGVLQAMSRILGIESMACQESALHGLGHWESKYCIEVATIIDNFIEMNPGISSQLVEYALSAKEGMVV